MTIVVHRLSKFLLPFTCACALVGSAALPASAAARTTVGISAQNSSIYSDPRFLNINITTTRYIAPWDTAFHRGEVAAARTWINDALKLGIKPFISFGGDGNYIPTAGQYKRAVKAFMRDFPKVRAYAAWNEPDWIYRSLWNKPGQAAAYFNALHQDCPRCTDVAGEVYLPTTRTRYTGTYTLATYLRAYIRGLHYRPSAWALHNYYDVRSHTTGQLRLFERMTSGPIWLTEIGGIERRGHWQFRNQGVFAASKDESFLFSLPKRFHRVTTIYHYDWNGSVPGPNTGWDSGLIGPGGVPRPAYWVVAKAAGPRPKKHTVRRTARR